MDAGIGNKGFSLMELLVAFAVSAVVLTGLGLLMFSLLNMSARTNANVELQNESQTAMNLVIDHIMDATGICMIETDAVPTAGDASNPPVCVLLGNLTIKEEDLNKVTFVGDAVIWDPAAEEMYLRTYADIAEGELDTSGAMSESEAALLAVGRVQHEVLSLSREDRLQYLMARHVTVFDMRPVEYYTFMPPESRPDPDHPGSTKEVHYFKNPFITHLQMEFEMEYQTGRTLNRQMQDEIAVRNRLSYIYLQRKGGSGMIKYYCK